MAENIFFEDEQKRELSEYLKFDLASRENLGETLPLMVYRLFEYSMREELIEEFGKERQIEVFRKAGYRAGIFFADHMLDISLNKNEFLAMLQKKMVELCIGVLRIESIDEEKETIILTVAEDADCSGLPLLGETVCNYDEGFIAGIFSRYTGKEYTAVEIDCWASGDRVCRFRVAPREGR